MIYIVQNYAFDDINIGKYDIVAVEMKSLKSGIVCLAARAKTQISIHSFLLFFTLFYSYFIIITIYSLFY